MARYTKRQRMIDWYARMDRAGFDVDVADSLRRIEMTLHRWAERECNGEIERDEHGRCYRGGYAPPHLRKAYDRIPDRETGALTRLDRIMAAFPEWRAYYQTDPRGCALYIVKRSDIPEGADIGVYYTRGIAVCY